MVTAKQTLRIDRHHITRVEGHGNIVVDLQAGVVKECQLEIVEAPRFLETALRRQALRKAPWSRLLLHSSSQVRRRQGQPRSSRQRGRPVVSS